MTKPIGGMDAFDQLPQELRNVLANYPDNMSSEFALQMIEKGFHFKAVIEMLEERRKK
jgi:hypothetical protein